MAYNPVASPLSGLYSGMMRPPTNGPLLPNLENFFFNSASNVTSAAQSAYSSLPQQPSFWSQLGSLGSSFLSGGGASGLLGGVASGLLGYFSQKSANEAMLEQTRMTNEHNYKMWQEQQAHNIDMFNMENQANIDMWNMQNEYNDPSAQVERLRAAGLNPSMMMGNNPSGTASSSPASANAKPADAPTMQAPPPQAFTPPGLQGLQQGLQAMLGIQQSITQSAGLPLQLQGLKNDNVTKAIANKSMAFDLGTKQMLSETQFLQQRMILENMVAQNALFHLDAKSKTILTKYFEKEQIDQIALRLANLNMMKAEIELTQAKTESEKVEKEKKLQEIKESIAREMNFYASAALNTAKTLTENANRNNIVDLTKNQSIVALETGIQIGHNNSMTEDTYHQVYSAIYQLNRYNASLYAGFSENLTNNPAFHIKAKLGVPSFNSINLSVPGFMDFENKQYF